LFVQVISQLIAEALAGIHDVLELYSSVVGDHEIDAF
jgi:hypothetical protein